LADVETIERDHDGTHGKAVPLARSLGYHVRQLSESWTEVVHRITEKFGVTEGQWRYLRELWEEDGLSQRDLSERVGRQGPTTVAALKLLERNGCVEVLQNEHDRRKTRVFLTDKGRAYRDQLGPSIIDAEAIGTAGLTPDEVATFKQLLVRIQRNLDGHNKTRNSWASWRTEQLAKDIGM